MTEDEFVDAACATVGATAQVPSPATMNATTIDRLSFATKIMHLPLRRWTRTSEFVAERYH